MLACDVFLFSSYVYPFPSFPSFPSPLSPLSTLASLLSLLSLISPLSALSPLYPLSPLSPLSLLSLLSLLLSSPLSLLSLSPISPTLLSLSLSSSHISRIGSHVDIYNWQFIFPLKVRQFRRPHTYAPVSFFVSCPLVLTLRCGFTYYLGI
jgi:hypothetical protein